MGLRVKKKLTKKYKGKFVILQSIGQYNKGGSWVFDS